MTPGGLSMAGEGYMQWCGAGVSTAYAGDAGQNVRGQEKQVATNVPISTHQRRGRLMED